MINLTQNPYVHSLIPKPRWRHAIDVVPKKLMLEWGVRLYTLMNLAWDYVDTICDLCIQQRVEGTKPLVRCVRQLKREYDQFRSRCVDSDFERKEAERAEAFEETFGNDFRLLFNAIDFEVSKLGLEKNNRTLVIAVQQALTVMDAVKAYAATCDEEMRKMGLTVKDCSMVQTEFMKLFSIVPLFAGDCYRKLEVRKLTAGILRNRIARIQVTNHDYETE